MTPVRPNDTLTQQHPPDPVDPLKEPQMLYLALYRLTVEVPLYFIHRPFVGEATAYRWVKRFSLIVFIYLAIGLIAAVMNGGHQSSVQ